MATKNAGVASEQQQMDQQQVNEQAGRQLYLEKRPSGIAFAYFDSGARENFLSSTLLKRMRAVAVEVNDDDSVKGFVITSAKPDTFLSGADVQEIHRMESEEQLYNLSRTGQELLQFLAAMKKPTLAGITGTCLGGGLELALACDKRVAYDSPVTEIGLPEVRIGLIPGIGGTQAVPQLVGLKVGADLILTSERISARKALEIGLVDELITSKEDLHDRFEQLCLDMIAKGKPKRTQPADLAPEKRKSIFATLQRSLRIRLKGNYPAPLMALEAMQKGLDDGREAGLEFEARAFASLAAGDISRNLFNLFVYEELAKQMALKRTGREVVVRNLGIIGGGIMGKSIAQMAVTKGINVRFRTANRERQEQAMQQIKESIARSESKMDEAAIDKLGTLESDLDDESFGSCDLIVEACAEDAQTKAQVLAHLANIAAPETVIATNTSSLSITELAKHMPNADRFVGIHFFHPVDKMPLVEVVSLPNTLKDASARAMSLVASLGKTPLALKDSPCLLVNRFLSAYVLEAVRMAEQSTPLNWLEQSAVDFGMPLGPLTLLDQVGIDVALQVSDALHKNFGLRWEPSRALGKVRELGLIGKKTGHGIYQYDENEKKLGFSPGVFTDGVVISDEPPDAESMKKLAERMIFIMVDEASRCLEEKIVRKPREIDLAVVLGLGFPPFRGGLLRYADSVGLPYVYENVERIYALRGVDLHASEYLKKLAQEGRGFYGKGAE